MPKIKDMAKTAAKSIGYRVSVYRDPFEDIRSMIGANNLTIFDVGANTGQTISSIQKTFVDPIIHAFEPSPKSFETLQQASPNGVHLNQCAVGAEVGQQEFREAGSSVMSSLLDPAPKGWNGEGWKDVIRRYPVKVTTSTIIVLSMESAD
jgi:FkbM family methyltransferase